MTVVKTHIIFAKYNAEADKQVVAALGKMSNDEREKDRGSYYGSLSGLARHLLGGTIFFGSMFTKTLSGNAAASKALLSLAAVQQPLKGVLTKSQWNETAAAIDSADKAYIAMSEALSENDLDAPVELNWYEGNPASVPLAFMLQQLTAHNTHHRGQISQILDELKIDNDFSGINVKFL
ncbi:MAG: DinB family protein [Spirochaetaceae bacterium]|jgi:uncharacterized damage-inducible protein DinB|nr:DinB family protein [Spirochaetaceae bacterium]